MDKVVEIGLPILARSLQWAHQCSEFVAGGPIDTVKPHYFVLRAENGLY
jgi:hypothetical protein